MTTLSDLDRQSLAAMPEAWTLTPACFTPNGLFQDQKARGLVEFELTSGDRYRVRRTAKASALLETSGAC